MSNTEQMVKCKVVCDGIRRLTLPDATKVTPYIINYGIFSVFQFVFLNDTI